MTHPSISKFRHIISSSIHARFYSQEPVFYQWRQRRLKPEAKPEPKEIEESSKTLLKCKVLKTWKIEIMNPYKQSSGKTSSRYASPQAEAIVLKLKDGTGLLFPSQSENA